MNWITMIKCLLVLSIIFISACSPQKDETKPATWLLKTLSERNQRYRSGMINSFELCQRMITRNEGKPNRRIDSLIQLDSTIEKEFRDWSQTVLHTESKSELFHLKSKALKIGQKFNPDVLPDSLDFIYTQSGEALKYFVVCYGLEIEHDLESRIGSSLCCLYERDPEIAKVWIIRNGKSEFYSSLDSIVRSRNNQKK